MKNITDTFDTARNGYGTTNITRLLAYDNFTNYRTWMKVGSQNVELDLCTKVKRHIRKMSILNHYNLGYLEIKSL